MSKIFTPSGQSSSGETDSLAVEDHLLFTRDSLLAFLQDNRLDRVADFASIGRVTEATGLPNAGGHTSVSSSLHNKSPPSPAISGASTSAVPHGNAHNSKKRGVFIVIEGLDRAGKSSQVELLSQYLKRRRPDGKVKVMKFPDRTTPIGLLLNSYLTDPSVALHPRAVHLLFSANRWELHNQILSDLNDGCDLIADRYAGSGVAYSRAKGLPLDYLLAADRQLPSPDLTIFLDVRADVAAKRGGYGEERYEKEEMQSKVRRAFAEIQHVVLEGESAQVKVEERGTHRWPEEEVQQDMLANTRWKTLDASKSLEEVFEEVKSEVDRVRDEVESTGRGIGGLWGGEVR